MCRLFAITAATDRMSRIHLLDRIMLQGNADIPMQRDGWGVTDGLNTYKGAKAYRDYSPRYWMEGLETDNIWLGHVRSASPNTELSQDAAHPYIFSSFVGAHNGSFKGSYAGFDSTKVKNHVNTDSFRVFYTLNEKLISGEKILIGDIIDEHLSLYEDDSAFVLLMLENNKLHVVRGPKTRDLFIASMGNGFILHTDSVVLKGAQDFAEVVGLPKIGEIEEVPELTYFTLEYGIPEIIGQRSLDWKPKKSTVYVTNYTRTDSSLASTQRNGKWMRVTDDPQGTDPNSTDGKLLALWLQIRQELDPMREGLVLAYMLKVIEESCNVTVSKAFSYSSFPVFELEIALAEILKNPLTSNDKKYIEEWNGVVRSADEYDTYVKNFSTGTPFWKMMMSKEIINELGGKV